MNGRLLAIIGASAMPPRSCRSRGRDTDGGKPPMPDQFSVSDTHALAWAAGLFDGEGSVFATKFVKRGRDSRRLHLAVSMTDFASVRRFAAVVQVGHIAGPYCKGGPRLPQIRWQTTRFEHGQMAIAMLWPWLGPNKRAQATRAMRSALWHFSVPAVVPPQCRKRTRCKYGHNLLVTRYTAPGGGTYCRICQANRRRGIPLGDAPLLNTPEVALEADAAVQVPLWGAPEAAG
jgi:hypothetical protein